MSDGREYILEVIPSPGTKNADFADIEKKLDVAKEFTKVVHVDVVDGIFAENKTFLDPAPFSKYKDDFTLEVHLMTDNPIQYVKPFADAGFKRFIGHVEKMPDPAAFVAQCQLYGEPGLAFDQDTPVDTLPVSLNDLDIVLIMTIKAGESGQQFKPELLEKVKKIRSQIDFEDLAVEVDGGINDQTIIQAKEAGANRFVVTSFLFDSENPKAAFEKLNQAIENT